MAFHIYWPALAVLTLFIACVIIALLRWGPRFCKTRHTTLPNAVQNGDQTFLSRQYFDECPNIVPIEVWYGFQDGGVIIVK